MKRRLFGKNLAALLAIPFVAKVDQYAPKVGKKITRGGVEKDDEWEEIKEVESIKGPTKREYISIEDFDNVLILDVNNQEFRMKLTEVSMQQEQHAVEIQTLDAEEYITTIPGRKESSVTFIGYWGSPPLTNIPFQKVEFKVLLSKDHFLEGAGKINFMSLPVAQDGSFEVELHIDISGDIRGTYEGNMLNTRGYER